jgi:hypothetical protein
MMNHFFELGPIRPPSEAKSLLIRVTRNCPWNQCAFCHTYRGAKFELRTVEDIQADIQAMRNIADEIKAISWGVGEGGWIGNATAGRIFENQGIYDDYWRSIAAWLYFGGESVFLQDANSLIMKTDQLVQVLNFIREKFPGVRRITSYCRSRTAAKKTVGEFTRLREAGLTRIHVGMETGYDPLLHFIQQVEGGQRIVAAGISLSEYLMPGLGGTRWTKEHAVESARVLNQINPDFIRLRSLQVREGTPLRDMMMEGTFVPLDEEGVVKEIRIFIENLDGIQSTVVSDHILTLLEEIEGTLPHDREKMFGIIDRYLGLPEEEKLIFRLGRRMGYYRRLDDLNGNRALYLRLQEKVAQYLSSGAGKMDQDMDHIRQNHI